MSKQNIVIIDYEAGNVQSVKYALERLGVNAEISNCEATIRKADKVIFPGVSEASWAMIKLKETGKIWHFDQISAVLKVPSTIIPTECNYVLNPGHPDFKKVAVKQAMPFKFDQRLNR